MDAIDLLKSQHREVLELIDRMKSARGDERRLLFEECADLLAVHFMLEEDHFYPGVHVPETEEGLLESVEEHLSAKRLLADMLDTPADDRRFLPRLTVLEIELRHHVVFEETDMFPRIEHYLGRGRLEELAQAMNEELDWLLHEGEPRRRILQQTEHAAEL